MKLLFSKNIGMFLFALIFVNVEANAQDANFIKMIDSILEKTIPVINSETLFNEISYHRPLVILDARESIEYEISHIEEAIYVGYDSLDFSILKRIPADNKIVIYCSIGYRSEKVAEEVNKTGHNNVYNLYGGIFDWVNSGYTIVDSSGRTHNIHPFNKDWEKWLEKGVIKYE